MLAKIVYNNHREGGYEIMVFKYNFNLIEGNFCVLDNFDKNSKHTAMISQGITDCDGYIVGSFNKEELKIIMSGIVYEIEHSKYIDLDYVISRLNK